MPGVNKNICLFSPPGPTPKLLPVRLLYLRSTILFLFLACSAVAQVADDQAKEAVRVTMTLNADGSRTTYQFDPANKKAAAITTGQDGKVRERIKYELDDRGRFASGSVSGPDGQFRFNSIYKYEGTGRLAEETHLGKDGTLINKFVYSYDAAGKPTGYAIFDPSGKVVGKTSAAGPTPSPPAKRK